MGAADNFAKIAMFPYGVTRAAIDVGSSLLGGDDNAPVGQNGRKLTAFEMASNAVNPGPGNKPPGPPDITDEVLQRARLAARQRLLNGQGMSSTFLTGPLGDLAKPTTSTSSLLGSTP